MPTNESYLRAAFIEYNYVLRLSDWKEELLFVYFWYVRYHFKTDVDYFLYTVTLHSEKRFVNGGRVSKGVSTRRRQLCSDFHYPER